MRERFRTAVSCYEQARKFLPNSSLIPQSLAFVARDQGQWERAESYFNEAERLDPRNANLLTRHAQFYIALRRFPEALSKLDQILKILPNDIVPWWKRRRLPKPRRPAASRDPSRSSPAQLPADPTAWEQLTYQAILSAVLPKSFLG